MFQAYEFEKVSAFYEPGRKNVEERLSRTLNLRQAQEMLFDKSQYGHFPDRKPGETEDEALPRVRRLHQRVVLKRHRATYAVVEFLDPLIEPSKLYGPKPWNYLKFDPHFAQSAECQTAEQAYEQRFASLDWMVLRDLQEGVVEHSFAPTDNPQRILTRRDGRTYNLGDHVYRVRRTEEPTGVVAHLELPELKIEGEAKKPPIWDFIDRHEQGVQAGIPLSVGIFGELMSLALYLQLPENPHPSLYVAIGTCVAGSAFSIGAGIRILRHRS